MKIAIVGNGQLLKNYGKQINKHDLVIRFNKAKTEGYEKLVGTKTDVLALVGETKLSYTSAACKIEKKIIQNINEIWVIGIKINNEYKEYQKKGYAQTLTFDVANDGKNASDYTGSIADLIRGEG